MTTAAGLAARLPLPQAIRSFVTDAHAEFGPFDFWRVRPRYPDRTFSGSLRLTVGNRTVDLVEVGPAHTPGDLMVFDRDRNVVFAGDILFIGQTPIMWEGPARNWIDALRLILDTRPAAIVPGHGPLATETDVTDLVSYFEWLDDSATRLCRNGIPRSTPRRRCCRRTPSPKAAGPAGAVPNRCWPVSGPPTGTCAGTACGSTRST